MRVLLTAGFAVLAAFAIVLGLGFAIHRQTTEVSDNAFGAAAAFAILGIAFAIYYLLNPSQLALPHSFRTRMRGTAQTNAAGQAHRRRIAELSADPAKRKYAALVQRGEWWTDDQILYNENPRMVATCAHLQPLEYAMRLAGFKVRLDPLRPRFLPV